jgi:Spy/CpxP family protein refolding chaperone
MQTRISQTRNWTLVAGTLCLVFMVASWTFGEQQPFQPNPPGHFMQPEGGGRMPQEMQQGMQQGQGMRRPNGPGMMPGGPDRNRKDILRDLLQPEIQKELALTNEQRQKLDDIRFNSEKESIQYRSSLQILQMELSRLIDAENPDRTAIDKKIQEISQMESALLRSSINSGLNARAVLTGEQRSKLTQFMQNRIKGDRMPPNHPFPRADHPNDQAPAAPSKP